MSLTDKTLVCTDCNQQFTFTVGEQQFYQERGFTNEPKRCPDCRSKKKAHGGRGGGGSRDSSSQSRQKFPATCSRCGTLFDAPFEPKPDRPIFCRDCFASNKPPRGGTSRY